jgi:predicted phosphoribosyltransferase/pimeloyl-ACP methyl ester carboxylesterase
MEAHPSARWTGAVTAAEDPPQLVASARRFKDRHDAGERLAAELTRLRDRQPVIVGMPRGGVPVAVEVARALDAPLDVVIVRKVGAPQNPEFAIGAVAEGGVRLLSGEVARALGLTHRDVQALFAQANAELSEYVRRYRGAREPLDVEGRTVILVDDGLATGRSAHAALQSLRSRGAARLILAVPVAAPESARALGAVADEVVCVEMPEQLWAVGYWYERFAPTSDAEVEQALSEFGRRPLAPVPEHEAERQAITIAADGAQLAAELVLPADARAVVVFAHGSGSSRHSSRNRSVARALNEAGYGTLLFDLLSEPEASDRANVFDIPLLASRLLAASEWLGSREEAAQLPLAYFGASTGAAAALSAAAVLGDRVRAVISRGGRPDLAANLPAVRAPTLLIVGGADDQVLELNRAAQARLRCPSELAVVPGATHLFEEPGALEQVSRLAIGWLQRTCNPTLTPAA